MYKVHQARSPRVHLQTYPKRPRVRLQTYPKGPRVHLQTYPKRPRVHLQTDPILRHQVAPSMYKSQTGKKPKPQNIVTKCEYVAVLLSVVS